MNRVMYSISWFETFAASVPGAITEAEVSAVAQYAPPPEYPRLIDVGCGVGRTTGPLTERGYEVTGLDTSVEALRAARRAAPMARYVALDQRYIGDLRWTFDVAIVLWNSFGFGDRSNDLSTLVGLQRVLRPGGRLLLDLYHPDWLASHEQSGSVDERGATIDRWVQNGRCLHTIRYTDGSVDTIEFNVYRPEEIDRLLRQAGFNPEAYLVWWKDEAHPGAEFARYQVVSSRPPRNDDGDPQLFPCAVRCEAPSTG